ncbi:hypothetical protein EV356DRAFT_457994, partial [Viridothelium virens]
LMDYINKLLDCGIPLIVRMVRNFALKILKKPPGKNWMHYFIKYYYKNLKSAYLIGLNLEYKKADSIFRIQKFFNLISFFNCFIYSFII